MATKLEIKTKRLAQHNLELIELGANPDEAKRGQTFRRLKLQEGLMNAAATRYCNGEITEEQLDFMVKRVTGNVSRILNGLPVGFEINLDPRGYALKINDSTMRQHYKLYGKEPISYRDWGGYGILAPEF